MQRISGTLAENGYDILLVGRKRKRSIPLSSAQFSQKRLSCFFEKGILFYVEFSIRLFLFLGQQKADAFCAIDLDTILPVLLMSKIRKKIRVYDAHEFFTEQKEIITRPMIHKIWDWIENQTVPHFKNGYTVNEFLRDSFLLKYGTDYAVIRNLPFLQETEKESIEGFPEQFILYQGAVNEGRCFETLVPAMKDVPVPLVIIGEGNFFQQTKRLIQKYDLQEKIILKGYIAPNLLQKITQHAIFGLTLFEATGLNQYHSLANRFFDYIMAAIPQVCVNFPEYARINEEYEVALMTNNTTPQALSDAMNKLLNDTVLYNRMVYHCRLARRELNWNIEQQKLLVFWKNIFTLSA
ncbi:MAG: glycosyltransferase [Bacteroidota bacterium]|nr:glycosyltransferase [Bacteroidota bacterium]